jgi:hypothetical protein
MSVSKTTAIDRERSQARANDLSATRVRELLAYDSGTGDFTWRVSRSHATPGKRAGCIRNRGYLQICVDYGVYRAHRLAWLYVFGEWPDGELDHINGDPADNRLCNLRLATHQQNLRNARRPRHNTSGFKGVSFRHGRGTWHASIKTGGKPRHLGDFSTAVEAHAAYCAAAQELFGEFWRAA